MRISYKVPWPVGKMRLGSRCIIIMLMLVFVIMMMEDKMGTATAGEDLQTLIKAWANQNPEMRTITFLEKKSGIDYSTVSRIWQGKNPECQTALAILNVVASKEEGLKYLKSHFPHAAKFHEREFSVPVMTDREALKPAFDKALAFVILALSYAGQASKSYIQTAYGEMGLKAAADLVKTGKFLWDNEKLAPAGPEDFFTFENKDDIIRACAQILGFASGPGGYPVALVGSLHDDEFERFKSLLWEFCLAAKDLVYSSRPGGSNVISLATVFVSLLGCQGAQQ